MIIEGINDPDLDDDFEIFEDHQIVELEVQKDALSMKEYLNPKD